MSSSSADSGETQMKKKIVLMSNDGVTFEVEEVAAVKSQTINQMIEDGCANDTIPLTNVNSKTLQMVIENCTRHAEADKEAGAKAAADEYDKELMEVDVRTRLFELMMTANYLNVKSLLDLTAQAAVDAVKGKTPDQIRDTFGIQNDFTTDEEDRIRKDNTCAFY